MDLNELFTQGQAVAVMLGAVAGALLSTVFYLLPPLKKWHEGLSDNWKPGVMALGVTIVTAGIAVLNWTDVWALVPKDIYGVITLVIAWFFGVGSNQTTYSTFVRSRKAT